MKTPQPTVSEKQLLQAVTTVLSHYIAETNPYILFNGLLDTLLDITDSEYGFIGEIFFTEDNQPYIQSYATTNIAWNQETQDLYEETKRKGMIFARPNSLYGAVLKTGQQVISNQPATDPRACGVPEGHPPLNAFMGLPFYGGGELLGVVGIANRTSGYQHELAESLQPFLTTCGNLILGYRSNLKHQQIELELAKYKDRLATINEDISLGAGYLFRISPPTLLQNDQPVLLTKKELALLSILADNINRPTPYTTLERQIWEDLIVSESSLRSLVRRLRKKIPELTVKNASGIGYMLIVE